MNLQLRKARWALNAAMGEWINCQCGNCGGKPARTEADCLRYRDVQRKIERLNRQMESRGGE